MTNPNDLLRTLVSQIPEMGEFQIELNDRVEEVMWNMFHVKLPEIQMKRGLWIYRYDIDDEFPYEAYDMKVHNEEGDTIYLYHISYI